MTRLIIPAVIFIAALAAQPRPERPAASLEIGANLPAQPLGPNDLIAVSVYDAPELSRTVRVSSDGVIRIPMLHRMIKAEGLLPADLEKAIAKALVDEQILVNPYVTITIAEYDSRPITVAGAVKTPLVFQAVGPISLLDALSRAQGLREDAGREILVSQTKTGTDGKAVTLTRRIGVRQLIDDADLAANLILTGGEQIRVPEVAKIYVVGNVKKPGAFPVPDGSDTTVLQMLALAEGLAPFATNQAFVYRREGAAGAKREISIPLAQIMERKSPDVPLVANDILYIPDSKGKRVTLGALEKAVGLATALGASALYVYH